MLTLNTRQAALFCTSTGIMLAPVLLFVGAEYLNIMLAVNCLLAACFLSVLTASAHTRAVSGLVLFGVALSLLLPGLPLVYMLAGSAAGALLAWSAPFWFQRNLEEAV